MRNFEEIIAKVAQENGTTPEDVLREMQLAIDEAYNHHDEEAQKLWDMMMHMPLQKCSLTADDGASPPLGWCTASAEMVHGGRERGAPDRHAGNYSGMPLRFRMDSPSIWMV